MKLKQISVLGLLLITLSVTAKAEVVAKPALPVFCMQTYNAYGPIYAPATRERMNWISSLLQGSPRCSVIQLQEVWNKPNIKQVEESLKGLYKISSPNRSQRIGVMSLFDSEIKSAETITFKVNSKGGLLDTARKYLNVKKAFHVVQAGVFDFDEDFYFINVHLHPNSQAVRLTQILDILDWRLQHQELKVLMSGDFNADENSMERSFMMSLMGFHDSLQEAFGGKYPETLCTYCANNPHSWRLDNHILDYIFVSNVGGGDTVLKVQDGGVNMRGPLREPLSDHFGVRVFFSLEKGRIAISLTQDAIRHETVNSLLDQAEFILSAQKSSEFKPYVEKVKSMKQQLQDKQGPFNDYFDKFN